MKNNTLISHHTIGFENNIITDSFLNNVRDSIANDNCDYVEFDVQITFDKKFIIYHDNNITIDGINKPITHLSLKTIQKNHPYIIEMWQLLEIIAGKRKAHVDLKFTSPNYHNETTIYEIVAIREILNYLPVEDIIITTLEDKSVKAIRKWSKNLYPNLLVGLSLGKTLDTNNIAMKTAIYLSEYYASLRLKKCNANLIVARKDLAHKKLLKLGTKMRISVLVWTVDDEQTLKQLMLDERVWMITTNKPDLALSIRDTLN